MFNFHQNNLNDNFNNTDKDENGFPDQRGLIFNNQSNINHNNFSNNFSNMNEGRIMNNNMMLNNMLNNNMMMNNNLMKNNMFANNMMNLNNNKMMNMNNMMNKNLMNMNNMKNMKMMNMNNNMMMNNMNNMKMMNMNNNMMMNNINNMKMMNMNNNMMNNMNNMKMMNNNIMLNNNMMMNNFFNQNLNKNNNLLKMNIKNNQNFFNFRLSDDYLMFLKMQIHNNELVLRKYIQMIYHKIYFNRLLKMKKILDGMDSNNGDDDDNEESNNQNNTINQELLDVIAEPNPNLQNLDQDNSNYDQNIPNELNSEAFIALLNLNKDLFNGFGNNLEGKWAKGENRGGKIYKPPEGWVGYGLNVLSKYDAGNNDWLACNGRQGEWCVAYHGAARGKSSDEVKNIVKLILENNLKPGAGQSLKDTNDDNHPGQKIGVGVYCSPNPAFLNSYAGIMEVEGNKYKIGFMLRVKPDKIRFSNSAPDEWILNGNFSEIRPYRILIKKAN